MIHALTSALVAALGGDWPQYNGPDGDRTSPETLALRAFPAAGPPRTWEVPLADGFSSFAVHGGRAYTLVVRDGREALVALDAATGKEEWSAPLGKREYDGGADAGADGNEGGDGPRSTPSVAGGRVFAFDALLGLHAFDAASGKPLWEHDLLAEFSGRNIRWQNAASPLVELSDSGELVLVAGGGAGESLLAFHADTGEVAWARGDETITHATPVAATLHGTRHAIFFVQSGLVAVAPATGDELWRTEFPYRTSSAASPVVSGDIVYCSAGYGVGAAAWRIEKQGAKLVPVLLWRAANKLINHWSTPVAKDGHLYGMFSFKEYGKGPLKCVELASGEERWSQDGFGPGNCILVGDVLVALSDAGELVLVEPQPKTYRELARADVLDGKCWSSPAWSAGALYLRSTREGVRLELAAGQ
jgi:outer membrane protein assembly factor BamB